MNTDESLSNIFDTEPMAIEPKQEILPAVNTEGSFTSNKIEADYDTSRDNLHALLKSGQEALEHALTVAKQSEHPRAFEVVGNLMKQLADVNQQLLDVHQQKKKLEEPSKGSASKEVTNNNAIFVGSTADLNKMIKKMTGE
jgi:hypothetical protein